MLNVTPVVWVVGGIVTVARLLFHAELWQRKEYRLDRILSVVLSPERRTLLSPAFFIGGTLLAVSWLAFWAGAASFSASASYLYLVVQFGATVAQARLRGISRPHVTLRALTLLLVTTALLAVYMRLVFRWPAPLPLHVATLIYFIPYLTALAVLFNAAPYTFRKQAVIAHARHYRAQCADLTVVGITGSFGKTSTKFFAQQLLQDREVAVTADRRNAPYVVAQDMLRALHPQLRYYLVEMGAYKSGEIAELVRLTQPTVGVITAIGNQHLALFGSAEKLLATKWELIAGLPREGIAILNAADAKLREKARGAHVNIVWFAAGARAPAGAQPTVWLEILAIHPAHIEVRVHINADTATRVVPLVSEALLPSVAAAVALTTALGVPPRDIFDHLPQLTLYPQTMQLREGLNSAPVIDDSYSANDAGVAIALTHLSRFSGKKPIVVLRPLEELGSEGVAVHERIGEKLATLNQPIFLLNHNYHAALQRGIARVPNTTTTLRVSPGIQDLLQQLRAAVTPESVVLLEGRMPDMVRKTLIPTL